MPKNQKELNAGLKKFKKIVKELHLDIINGKFANNYSLDFEFKLDNNFVYQAHLMVKNPEHLIKKHWAKIQTFIPQFEEIKDPERYIHWMKNNGRKAAFALKPETKINQVKHFLKEIDLILILTVQPGFYGSKFLSNNLNKIKEIKKINPKTKVIIDGGINPETIVKAKKSGGDYFVSGSYIHTAENPQLAINSLIKAIKSVKKIG
jgi:ribulose-phosphate 3-epimerase